jgi:broad specificity phosphatase PhoE
MIAFESLFLVRHGETVHNVAGIAQGWNDSELSETGRGQVARLADRIAAEKPDALYSSSLRRAMTTAEAIGAVTALPVQPLDDLREMSYGRWEGRSFLDVRREDDELYRRWIDDPDCACPGGESHNDVLTRVKRALDHVAGKRVVVVAHGTAIRIGATALLHAPISLARYLAVDNAAVSHFVRRGDRLVLKLWNDTKHTQ